MSEKTTIRPGPHTAAMINIRNNMQKIKPWQWAAIFLMSAVWLILLMPTTKTKRLTPQEIEAMPVPVDEAREKTLRRINKHLQFVQKQKELSELSAQVEINEMARNIDTSGVRGPNIDLSAYERPRENQVEKNIYEDLNGPDRSYDTPMTPEERINANLAMRRWLEDYQQHQTYEYIQEFIENARREGFEVKINDKLEVVEIRPIPKQQRYKGLQSIRGLSSK